MRNAHRAAAWLRFNAVGAAGFGVQMALLALVLRSGAGIVLATAIAVEAAILHNFFWHRRWTFGSGQPFVPALIRFHMLNGAVSLAGNILIAWLLAAAGVSPFASGLIAVAVCSLANFFLAGRYVFADS